MIPLIRIASVVALIAVVTFGQTVSQLPACAAFNDAAGSTPSPANYCNAGISTTFVAATSFIATELELYYGFVSPGGLGVNVMNVTSGQQSTSGSPPPSPFGSAWHTFPLAPISFSAGDTCVIVAAPGFTGPGMPATMTLYTNPTGTAPIPVTVMCFGTLCGPFMPQCSAGTSLVTLMVRLRGPACVGGAPASTTTGGAACGSPLPMLTSGFATVGNAAFALTLQNGAPVGAGAHLFIAEGSVTQGVPVEPGHPCALYLNLGSLANLASLGYEPIASASVNSSGYATFPMPIPNLALLIGYRVTFQAAILDPSGIPLVTVPGVALKATNALHLQIGG
jgi:hypothetical protein